MLGEALPGGVPPHAVRGKLKAPGAHERADHVMVRNDGHSERFHTSKYNTHRLRDGCARRTSKVSEYEEVARCLADIVREGPVPCQRAYRVYARHAGIQRIGRHLRSLFNASMYRAVRQGLVLQEDEWGVKGQSFQIVRAPDTPPVVLRTRGHRDLDEIPPRELAEVMRLALLSAPDLARRLFSAMCSTTMDLHVLRPDTALFSLPPWLGTAHGAGMMKLSAKVGKGKEDNREV